MCDYWTLTLIFAVLSSALSCYGYHNDFHYGFKPIRYYGYRGSFPFHGPHVTYRVTHGPYYYKPPHNDFHIPHRGFCNWPALGVSGENKGSEDIGNPKPLPHATSTITTIKDTVTTPSNIILTSSRIPHDVCMKKRPDDHDSNPVCGSNGVTYKNVRTLDCAKWCGIDVSLIKAGRCDKDDIQPTVSSTTIVDTVLPTTSSVETIRKCLLNCPSNTEVNPVCGNNGVTYNNPLQFLCAKMCGINVTSIKPGRCGGEQPTLRPTTNVTTVLPVTTSKETLQTCLSNCPSTPEYNPVCGSDGVTYKNFNHLSCAKYCGVNVTFERASRCPTSGSTVTTSSTTTVIPSSTPSMEVIRTCMLNCPTTSEYNPICGSNGVTYDNPSRFECAKMCGLNIQMLRRSRCEVTGSSVTPNTNTAPNSTSATTPTSISISSPITNATPIPTKPNVTPITPNVTPTSPNVAPTTPNGLDFTIPQDILDSIFTTDYGGLIDERHERRV